jgi:gliding motility-associated-like protein
MPDGTGYQNIHEFDLSEEYYPYGSLLLEGGFLYGTTYLGGTNDSGAIFKIATDGSGYVVLHDFETTTGSYPYGTLIYEGGFLFGMTNAGGGDDLGTIFKIMTDGTGYASIYDFDGPTGSNPYGSLFWDGAFLYGMTETGGANNFGVIFKIKPDGTGFETLHEFELTPGFFPNLNGAYPRGALIAEGPFLYGMTTGGGSGDGESDGGILFRIMPNGSGFEKLQDFDFATGAYPYGSLISDGTFLYGTTSDGGVTRGGVVFKFALTAPPTIIINPQPADVIVCPGDVATFTTGASGTTNITYQWQYSIDEIVFNDIANDSHYSGVSTPTLSVNTTGDFGEGRYRCRINGDLAAEVFTADEGLFFGSGCTNQPPVIEPAATAVPIEGVVTVDLLALISDPDGNLDLSTLSVITPSSEQGASVSINASSQLVLDYGGVLFSGTDRVTLEVCDLAGVCTQQVLTIEVIGDIIIHNAFSPNGDGQNEIFLIDYIQLFPDTQSNQVFIYNRWGDEVFSISNYNNDDRVFRGMSNSGKELVTGTYFYKIEFSSGRAMKTGYLSLKR